MGFWRRACATVVDAICILVTLIPSDAFRRWFIASGDLGDLAIRALAVGEHLLVLAYLVFEVAAAASLGKIVFGIEIASCDGSEATTAVLLNRWTCKWSFLLVGVLFDVFQNLLLAWLANLLLLIVLIGCLAVLGDSKMAWHDLWARTAVYRARDRRRRSGFEVTL